MRLREIVTEESISLIHYNSFLCFDVSFPPVIYNSFLDLAITRVKQIQGRAASFSVQYL